MWTHASDGAGNVKAMGSSRFAYDALSCLTEGRVVANGTTYTQNVELDLFGNITANVTTTFGSRATPTQVWSNHLTSGTYNPAGSLTSWNLWSYDWDPVEMMKRRTTSGKDWRYVYTAGDERFWGVDRLTWETSDFTLRDLDGKVLRVYEAGEGKWSRFTDYVWRGDALLARDFSYTRPEAFHLDHLGTPRLLTNHRAERLAQPNYYPFGEEITVNTQVAERMKFTGHERDMLGSAEVADDLDYMHARFANPITGRFLSVDPVGGLTRRPQTWNRYSYVTGGVLKFTDPRGLTGALSFIAPSFTITEYITVTGAGLPPDLGVPNWLLWFIMVSNRPVADSGGPNPLLSAAGLQHIRRFERFMGSRYLDSSGHCTIGYGHLVNRGSCSPAALEQYGGGISPAAAEALLAGDVQRVIEPGLRLVTTTLGQGQMDALGSLVFNVGPSQFASSRALSAINSRNFGLASIEWLGFNRDRNGFSLGLYNRRLNGLAQFWGIQ